jgi:choline-glycine betaine transporter
MVTSKRITGAEEPDGWNRVVWALVLGGVSLVLMYLKGLEALQTSSIIGSFPIMFVAIIIMAAFYKEISKGWGNNPVHEIDKAIGPSATDLPSDQIIEVSK